MNFSVLEYTSSIQLNNPKVEISAANGRMACSLWRQTEAQQSYPGEPRMQEHRQPKDSRIKLHSKKKKKNCTVTGLFSADRHNRWVFSHPCSPTQSWVALINGWLLWNKFPSQMVPEVKNPSANAGDVRDTGSIPELGRSPGEGNGNPLQYSCLENPMKREARWATAHRVTKSRTRLKQLSTYTCTHNSTYLTELFWEWHELQYMSSI